MKVTELGEGKFEVMVDDVKVFITHPKKIEFGIVLYGQAASTRNPESFHKILKKRIRSGRYSYRCDCEHNFYRGKQCVHIAAFHLAERGVNV